MDVINLPQALEVVTSPVTAEIRPANKPKPYPSSGPTLTKATTPYNEDQKEEHNTADQKNNFFSIAIGSFIQGRWAPTKFLEGEEPCSSWNLCFESLKGINITTTFTDQYIKKGNFSIDVDYSFMAGYRSGDKDWNLQPITKDSGYQFSIAAVPTIRLSKLGNSVPIGISWGVGPSLTLGNRVVNGKENFSPLLSRVNFEITIPLDKHQNTTIFAGLVHDCTFLTLLRNSNGYQFGDQWYVAGIRKKL